MALLLSLMPVLVILACRTLCTLGPPPVPTYLKKRPLPTPVPVPWAPDSGRCRR